MDAKIVYKKLKRVVDLSKKEKSRHIRALRSAIIQVSNCVLENSYNGIYLVPRAKELLLSIPDDALVALLWDTNSFIEDIQTYYNPNLPDKSKIHQDYSEQCSIDEGLVLMEKVMPMMEATPDISTYNKGVVTTLSIQERRQFVDFAIECIQTCGQHTEWSSDVIYLHFKIFQVLYAICKYDSLLRLFFHFANNMIDRMPSASLQTTRDFTESIIKIGYAEHMESDAYFSASKAYTLCHNAIAGLFYLHITITSIKQTNIELSKDDVSEILWQMMKILRELPFFSEIVYNTVIHKFRDFRYEDYKVLSFMHTAFSLKLKKGQRQVVPEIHKFLDEHIETIKQYMEFSALQWYSILYAVETIYPDLFNDQLNRYKAFFGASIDREGNRKSIDVIHGENLSEHLLGTLSQLEETRDSKDYASDNANARLIANKP